MSCWATTRLQTTSTEIVFLAPIPDHLPTASEMHALPSMALNTNSIRMSTNICFTAVTARLNQWYGNMRQEATLLSSFIKAPTENSDFPETNNFRSPTNGVQI
ncbi:hypothetical protein DSECCO2_505480 [anaerobic digester metagenome]